MLFIELLQLRRRVGADPRGRYLQLFKLLQGVPDALGLNRSARGPGLREKIQKQLSASEIGQFNLVAILVRQGKGRGLVSGF
jgi:hypothetical protein